MFTIGDYNVLDIIYGGSLLDLGCWIGFGICSQLILGILVCGRRPMWADACWGLLKVQLLLAVLVNVDAYVFFCGCCMDRGAVIRGETKLLLYKVAFYIAYFSVMAPAIWWRYKTVPRLTPVHVAGILAPVIDLGVLLISVLAVFYR